MPKETVERVAHLPQDGSAWVATACRARAWISPKGRPSYRPYMIMVMEASCGLIRLGKVVADAPDADVVLSSLIYAMRNPVAGSGKRVRPSRIAIDDRNLVGALAGPLSQIGIQCVYEERFPPIDFAMRDLERSSRGDDDRPGLLDIPGTTPSLLEELFAAAAFFHGRAPWRRMDNWMPVEVRYPAGGPCRYLILLGYGGEEYGLAYYPTIADLRANYSDLDPERVFERVTAVSLTYGEANLLTFDDLDAIEKYRWPVASSTLYPFLIKMIPPGKRIGVPDVDEIKLMAAALRTLPDFVSKTLQVDAGKPQPGQGIFCLPDVHGGKGIALRFPVDIFGTDN